VNKYKLRSDIYQLTNPFHEPAPRMLEGDIIYEENDGNSKNWKKILKELIFKEDKRM